MHFTTVIIDNCFWKGTDLSHSKSQGPPTTESPMHRTLPTRIGKLAISKYHLQRINLRAYDKLRFSNHHSFFLFTSYQFHVQNEKCFHLEQKWRMRTFLIVRIWRKKNIVCTKFSHGTSKPSSFGFELDYFWCFR